MSTRRLNMRLTCVSGTCPDRIVSAGARAVLEMRTDVLQRAAMQSFRLLTSTS